MTTYKGVNHLAMVTGDMDMTIRFWRDLLGMRLVAGLGNHAYRHYFFEISATDMIAFFEWPDIDLPPVKDHGVPVKGAVIFDHVSIGVSSMEDLVNLSKKLNTSGFWVSEIIDHGFIYSIYTFDPNHIPIEFSYDVPLTDIRKHPQMKDMFPAKNALEGAEPQEGKWQEPDTHQVSEMDFSVYPGEGIIFRKK